MSARAWCVLAAAAPGSDLDHVVRNLPADFPVKLLTSARELLAAAHHEPGAPVIIAHRLPDMSGSTLARRLAHEGMRPMILAGPGNDAELVAAAAATGATLLE